MTEDTMLSKNLTEPISIPEAARRLRMSERTIYRMIKSGKLDSVKMSDNSMTKVILSPTYLSQSYTNISDNTVNLSDIKTEWEWDTLKKELHEKDEHIRKLIDNQTDLIATIHQLQGQVHELSRWILDHTSEKKPDSLETSSVSQVNKGISGLFHGWIKTKPK